MVAGEPAANAAGGPQLQRLPVDENGAAATTTESFPAIGARSQEEAAPDIWRSQSQNLQGSGPAAAEDPGAEGSGVQALSFADVLPEKEFDAQGLGAAGAMLLRSPRADCQFFDRHLMRQLLLCGKSSTTTNKLVDTYGVNVKHSDGSNKRKKVRPAKVEVMAVIKAAFEQFPRLGAFDPRGGDREVVLKAWPNSEEGQKLFHNELMRCCRVSLSAVSQRRAAFHDARPAIAVVPEDGVADIAQAPVADAQRAPLGVEPPGTPPGGNQL